jgi:regulator of RNase E activity RraA
VIVVAAGGALDNAIIGEMMGRYAVSRGIAGIVIDGAVRDIEGLAELPIPVYARGVTTNGPGIRSAKSAIDCAANVGGVRGPGRR